MTPPFIKSNQDPAQSRRGALQRSSFKSHASHGVWYPIVGITVAVTLAALETHLTIGKDAWLVKKIPARR